MGEQEITEKGSDEAFRPLNLEANAIVDRFLQDLDSRENRPTQGLPIEESAPAQKSQQEPQSELSPAKPAESAVKEHEAPAKEILTKEMPKAKGESLLTPEPEAAVQQSHESQGATQSLTIESTATAEESATSATQADSAAAATSQVDAGSPISVDRRSESLTPGASSASEATNVEQQLKQELLQKLGYDSKLPTLDINLNKTPANIEQPLTKSETSKNEAPLNPSADPEFKAFTPEELKIWVETQRIKAEMSKQVPTLSVDEIENKVTQRGFGTTGKLFPSLSFKISATEQDINQVADSIVKATVEQKDAEAKLQESIQSANDLGSFYAGAGGVATTFGVGWAVSKLAANAPAAVRIPAMVAAGFVSGSIVNNELSGKEMFDKDGFVKNGIDSAVAWGIYKSLQHLPTNQTVSAETLAKVGMDPTRKIAAGQFANEWKLHHHNIAIDKWKALDKNKAMDTVQKNELLMSFFGPFGTLIGSASAKAEMAYIKNGPQMAVYGEGHFASKVNPLNYTPFRYMNANTRTFREGTEYIGMGGDKVAQIMARGMQKNGTLLNDSLTMSIGEYNTRALATNIYGTAAAAYAFGAANKTGDVLVGDNGNKSFTDHMRDINREGLGSAFYAPLVLVGLRRGDAAFGTAAAIGGKGVNSFEHSRQQQKYEELKKLGTERAKMK